MNADHTDTVYTEENVPDDIWKSDAQTLPLVKLRKKYRLTFSSFNNTVYGRGKGPNGELKHNIRLEVQHFRGFLLHFGPRRKAEFTLDRLDCSNAYYGPGLCEWRDKTQQARNRRTSIIVDHPETGDPIPLMQLAEEWKVNPQRLRRWHRQGWSTGQMRDAALLGLKPSPCQSADLWPWPLDQRRLSYWEHHYKRCRQPADEWGYELRSEFAARWLTTLLRQMDEWLATTWEQYIDPDPRTGSTVDDLPAEVRLEFDSKTQLYCYLEDRLAIARDVITSIDSWTKRDRVPKNDG